MSSPIVSPALPHSPEELQHRLNGLGKLLDVARLLAAEIEPQRMLRTITRAACAALECDRASLFQFDPATQELYTKVVTELEIAEIRHPVGQGITGDVARSRRLAHVPQPALDPRWDSSIDRATGYHTHNILAAPLVSQHDGDLLGVLELINKRDGAFSAFDEELLQAFSQHAATALDRTRLLEMLRKRDEVEMSLNVARDIQRGFMPRRLPKLADYELATWWYPNQAVGGDYLDVLELCDGRWALVMADVSGHGLGPSLLMASVRAALRALVLEHSDPQVLLSLLARSMVHDLQDGRFITMILALLDTGTHQIHFANAGHGPALHFQRTPDRFEVLSATGLPLGVVDDPRYTSGPLHRLEAGDLLVLCTDGVVEAMNAEDEPFGQRRLERLVRASADCPAQQVVDRIAEEVCAHYVGESPADDLMLLVLRRVNATD